MVRSAKEIMLKPPDLLRTARFGLEDMTTRQGQAKTGLRNAVVFAGAIRAVGRVESEEPHSRLSIMMHPKNKAGDEDRPMMVYQ